MNKYTKLYFQKVANDLGIKQPLKDLGSYSPSISLPRVMTNAAATPAASKSLSPDMGIVKSRALRHAETVKGLSPSGNNVSATQTPATTNTAQHSALSKGYSAAPNGVQVVPNAKMIMPSQKQMKLDSEASLVNYAPGGVLDTPSINPNAPTPAPAKGIVPPINKQVMEQGLRSGKYKLLDDKGNPVEIPPLY
jgi:hypothetical protein